MGCVLGLDTSNYTTSAAWFDGETGENAGKLLEVPQGSLGLRQSEALFQHVKRLPEIVERLNALHLPSPLSAVGASTRPREVEGSYMPCFLAGESQARVLATTMAIPFYPCSHQQGHIAAAAWSAGRMDLLDRPHLVWHLSGGTTELLHVVPDGVLVKATCIGGTTDISAGQLIDRTGKRLGLAFPAGKAVDALSREAAHRDSFRVKVHDASFSFSGLENKMNALAQQGTSPADICWFVLASIIQGVETATRQALEQYPGCSFLRRRRGLQPTHAGADDPTLRGRVCRAPLFYRQRHGHGDPHLASPPFGTEVTYYDDRTHFRHCLNQYVKGLLDRDRLLSQVLVRSEISNYKVYPSGHHYFSLKDAESSICCVMSPGGSASLRFRPENGMKVVVPVGVCVFPGTGCINFTGNHMMPDGMGELAYAFEQLKNRLHKEGLFDPARKKPLPAYPHTIALITSPAGAAVRDMIRILGARWPMAKVLVVPVRVQGEGAAQEIAQALTGEHRPDGRPHPHRPGRRLHGGPVGLQRRGGGPGHCPVSDPCDCCRGP